MAAPTHSTARIWLGLAVLCLAAAVNLLQSASLSPLLPSIGNEFGATDAVTGQLATIGSLVGFAFSLAAAPWMDRWSRRAWLRLESALVVLGVLLFALAPNFVVLACGRIIAASGAALIMANCMTGARELFPETLRRNRAIGFIVSATTLVFILGLPLITQVEARLGWRTAMASIAIPGLLMFVGSYVFPAGLTAPVRASAPGHPLEAFRVVLRDRRVRSLLGVLGLVSALYTGWFVYFGVYATSVFAVSAEVLGLLFLASGATQLLANNLAPLLMRRFAPGQMLVAMMAGVATALLLTGIAITSLPSALLAAIVVLNGTGMAYIATNVMLLDSDLPRPGAVMALAAATGSLGAAFGPLLTGASLAGSGSIEAAYRVLGLLAPLAIIVLWFGARQRAVVAVAERAS